MTLTDKQIMARAAALWRHETNIKRALRERRGDRERCRARLDEIKAELATLEPRLNTIIRQIAGT